MSILLRVLWVASHEHAHDYHQCGHRGRKDGCCRIFVVVVELGHKHSEHNVQAFQSADGKTYSYQHDEPMSHWVKPVLTLAHLPEVHVEYAVDYESRFRLDQHGREHGHVDQHAAFEEQM